MVEAGRGNNNLFSNSPIDVIGDIESSSSRLNCSLDSCPCVASRSSIHVEFAVEAPNTFVSEHRYLSSEVITMHNES